MDPSRGDSRYNLNYSMSSIGLSLADQADLYGNPAAAAALGGRPPSGGLIQSMGGGGLGLSGRSSSGLMSNTTQCQSLSNPATNSTGGGPGQQQQQQSRGIKRTSSDCYDDHHRGGGSSMSAQMQGLDSCAASGNGQQQQGGANVSDVVDDSYNSMQNKKSPPANGKKTKGRVKIKMEYIDNKLRRYTTFSKRKTGIMKKAYELSTLTGTQVMLLVASETGHVYTFATRKLQPMITSEAGKQLIQTCLNSPDPPSVGGGDQRMSATGFEETELSYNIADEDSKDDRSPISSANESDESSDVDSPGPLLVKNPVMLDSTHFKNAPSTTVSTNLLAPTTSAGTSQSQNLTIQQLQPETTPKTKTISDGNILKSLTQTQKNINSARSTMGPASSSYNNVVYPTTALSGVPQEALLQLIQSGHLQLHTEEDGSGHQYVTIPLSLPSSISPSTTSNRVNASNANSDVIHTNEKPKSKIGIVTSSSTQQTATCSTSNEVKIKQELID